MKRVAEKQLTKDDEGEEEDQDVGSGFKKADVSVLSERKIRALPKRAMGGTSSAASTPQPSGNTAPQTASRFGVFAGFGSGSSTTAFSFTPTAPTTSSTSTGTTKDTPITMPLNGASASVTSAGQSTYDEDKQKAAQKYCKALLGLNRSFVDAVNKAMDEDPFLDISHMLQQYLTLRSVTETEFKTESSKSSGTKYTTSKTQFSFSGTAAAAPSTSTSTAPKTAPFPFGTSGSQFLFGSKAPSSEAKSSAPATSTSGTNGLDFGAVEKPAESTIKPVFDWKASPTGPLTPGFSAFTSKPAGSGTSSTAIFSGLSPRGSIGNPVGFGFGSQPSTPKDESPTSLFSSKPSEDAKPAGDVIPIKSTEEAPPSTGPDSEDTNAATAQTADANPYDADGPGEEDETNVYESKAKILKMMPKGEGVEWTSLGVGILKLKVHKDGSKRMLMRNSSNGKILVNCKLHQGMKGNVQGKGFSFRVPGEGELGGLRLFRVKTSTEAQGWVDSIAQEVDSLGSS
ncbi:hypothetical protein M422DRAFT_27961 [Sphaerobolus stellatus SS14]|nr:hypothetical protein M422DRAFT_27961 [Sphaerobolus stellatus SS14]